MRIAILIFGVLFILGLVTLAEAEENLKYRTISKRHSLCSVDFSDNQSFV